VSPFLTIVSGSKLQALLLIALPFADAEVDRAEIRRRQHAATAGARASVARPYVVDPVGPRSPCEVYPDLREQAGERDRRKSAAIPAQRRPASTSGRRLRE